MHIRLLFSAALLAVALLPSAALIAQTADAQYLAAKKRDDAVRQTVAGTAPVSTAARTRAISEARAVISAYEALVRRYRASGYADNALFNAASLADTLHERFALSTDRDTALRLYNRVMTDYPTTPLQQATTTALARLNEVALAQAPIAPGGGVSAQGSEARSAATESEAAVAAGAQQRPTEETAPARAAAPAAGRVNVASPARRGRARLLAIERAVLPEAVRITLSLDREVTYHEEVLSGPARVFFDLKNADAAPGLQDAVLRYPSDVVRQIRIGRHPDATRVVLDLEGVRKHSVYTLYNPYRLVIDAESATAVTATPPAWAKPLPSARLEERAVVASVVPALPGTTSHSTSNAAVPPPLPPTPVPAPPPLASPPTAMPTSPHGNAAGGFSIARQLGLSVSRIVIDPGHGGHDPGARAKGINEADVTLDIALRLEKLLQQEPGVQVVLTRREDVYVPLEERTAVANREGADLFLSIHVNTSRSSSASGVETYFLSFAGSADAEAVAARENASHVGEMHRLPDIVRAITLNSKVDESRDLAGMVQEALVSRLRRSNKAVVSRGVKKAPFVVLIGAEMPSVLAEVSFLTNKQELQLLKTTSYKERIAEALHASVLRYRRSLKSTAAAER